MNVNWAPPESRASRDWLDPTLGRCTLQTNAARGLHSSHDTDSSLNVVKPALVCASAPSQPAASQQPVQPSLDCTAVRRPSPNSSVDTPPATILLRRASCVLLRRASSCCTSTALRQRELPSYLFSLLLAPPPPPFHPSPAGAKPVSGSASAAAATPTAAAAAAASAAPSSTASSTHDARTAATQLGSVPRRPSTSCVLSRPRSVHQPIHGLPHPPAPVAPTACSLFSGSPFSHAHHHLCSPPPPSSPLTLLHPPPPPLIPGWTPEASGHDQDHDHSPHVSLFCITRLRLGGVSPTRIQDLPDRRGTSAKPCIPETTIPSCGKGLSGWTRTVPSAMPQPPLPANARQRAWR